MSYYVNDFRVGLQPVKKIYLNKQIIWERLDTYSKNNIKLNINSQINNKPKSNFLISNITQYYLIKKSLINLYKIYTPKSDIELFIQLQNFIRNSKVIQLYSINEKNIEFFTTLFNIPIKQMSSLEKDKIKFSTKTFNVSAFNLKNSINLSLKEITKIKINQSTPFYNYIETNLNLKNTTIKKIKSFNIQTINAFRLNAIRKNPTINLSANKLYTYENLKINNSAFTTNIIQAPLQVNTKIKFQASYCGQQINTFKTIPSLISINSNNKSFIHNNKIKQLITNNFIYNNNQSLASIDKINQLTFTDSIYNFTNIGFNIIYLAKFIYSNNKNIQLNNYGLHQIIKALNTLSYNKIQSKILTYINQYKSNIGFSELNNSIYGKSLISSHDIEQINTLNNTEFTTYTSASKLYPPIRDDIIVLTEERLLEESDAPVDGDTLEIRQIYQMNNFKNNKNKIILEVL